MGVEGYRGARDGKAMERELHCRGELSQCSVVHTSSVTGVSAAVFQHSVGQRIARTDNEGRTRYEKKLHGSVLVSGDLRLETEHGTIHVPEGSFRFEADCDIDALPSTAGDLPKACRHLSRGGVVLYGEKFLSVGDVVELRATVRTNRDPEIAFEVLPDRDAVLVDRTLESMGIDVDDLRNNAKRQFSVMFMVLIFGLVGLVYALLRNIG